MSNARPATAQSVLIFILLLCYFAFPMGNRPFYTRGEGREAIVTKAMYDTGNWILPHNEPVDISTKPPMLHWLGALTSEISGGINEFTVRFPSAFCGALAAAAFFFFLTAWVDRQTAFLTFFVLVSCFEWIRSASHARVDMCFVCGLVISFLALFQTALSWKNNRQHQTSWLVLAALGMAFATLGKGPAGIVFPLALVALFQLCLHRGKITEIVTIKSAVPCFLTVASALVLSALWYIGSYKQGGSAFVEIHFFKENLGRFVEIDGKTQGHEKPFYFALLYLVLGVLPWTFALSLPLANYWRNRKTLVKQGDPVTLFMGLWLVLILGIVSVSTSKRDVYLLPAFPAFAYLFVVGTVRELGQNELLRSRKIAANVITVVGIAIALAGALVFYAELGGPIDFIVQLFPAKVRPEIGTTFAVLTSHVLLLVAFVLFAIALLYSADRCRKGRAKEFIATLSAGSLFATLALNALYLPGIAQLDSPTEFMKSVNSIVPKESGLFQYRDRYYSIMYYADRYLPTAESATAGNGAPNFYLVRESDQARFVSEAPSFTKRLESTTNAANGDSKLLLLSVP